MGLLVLGIPVAGHRLAAVAFAAAASAFAVYGMVATV
jgi:hypothetical protein